MMETIIEVPAPAAEDSETVVAALETAAIFCAKGDLAEALRFLQRAAEASAESGDDIRTLSLARLAADIRSKLHEQPVTAVPRPTRQLPKAPPRPSRPSPTSEGIAPSTTPSNSASSAVPRPNVELTAALESGPAVGRYARPSAPPPSGPRSPRSGPAASSIVSSPRRVDPAREAATTKGGVTTGSPSSSASQHGTPAPRESAEQLPRNTAAPDATTPDATSDGATTQKMPSSNAPPQEAPAPAATAPDATRGDLTGNEATADSVTGREAPNEITAHETPPNEVMLNPPGSSGALNASATPDVPARLRKAARVSVVPSLIEPNLFLVRLLNDDGALPKNAAEGVLVLLDPESEVFARSAALSLDSEKA